jgi:hypothetical protein
MLLNQPQHLQGLGSVLIRIPNPLPNRTIRHICIPVLRRIYRQIALSSEARWQIILHISRGIRSSESIQNTDHRAGKVIQEDYIDVSWCCAVSWK